MGASSSSLTETQRAALADALAVLTAPHSTDSVFPGERFRREAAVVAAAALSGLSERGSGTWVPDSWARNCQHCAVEFTARSQPHHCHCCGLCVCAACSSVKAVLQPGCAPKRVCRVCHKQLGGRGPADVPELVMGAATGAREPRDDAAFQWLRGLGGPHEVRMLRSCLMPPAPPSMAGAAEEAEAAAAAAAADDQALPVWANLVQGSAASFQGYVLGANADQSVFYLGLADAGLPKEMLGGLSPADALTLRPWVSAAGGDPEGAAGGVLAGLRRRCETLPLAALHRILSDERRTLVISGHGVAGAVAQVLTMELQHRVTFWSEAGYRGRLFCFAFGSPLVASRADAADAQWRQMICNVFSEHDALPLAATALLELQREESKWRREVSVMLELAALASRRSVARHGEGPGQAALDVMWAEQMEQELHRRRGKLTREPRLGVVGHVVVLGASQRMCTRLSLPPGVVAQQRPSAWSYLAAHLPAGTPTTLDSELQRQFLSLADSQVRAVESTDSEFVVSVQPASVALALSVVARCGPGLCAVRVSGSGELLVGVRKLDVREEAGQPVTLLVASPFATCELSFDRPASGKDEIALALASERSAGEVFGRTLFRCMMLASSTNNQRSELDADTRQWLEDALEATELVARLSRLDVFLDEFGRLAPVLLGGDDSEENQQRVARLVVEFIDQSLCSPAAKRVFRESPLSDYSGDILSHILALSKSSLESDFGRKAEGIFNKVRSFRTSNLLSTMPILLDVVPASSAFNPRAIAAALRAGAAEQQRKQELIKLSFLRARILTCFSSLADFFGPTLKCAFPWEHKLLPYFSAAVSSSIFFNFTVTAVSFTALTWGLQNFDRTNQQQPLLPASRSLLQHIPSFMDHSIAIFFEPSFGLEICRLSYTRVSTRDSLTSTSVHPVLVCMLDKGEHASIWLSDDVQITRRFRKAFGVTPSSELPVLRQSLAEAQPLHLEFFKRFLRGLRPVDNEALWNLLRRSVVLYRMRAALAATLCIGVVGTGSVGKSELLSRLFGVNTNAGAGSENRTRTIMSHAPAPGLVLVDSPGLDDSVAATLKPVLKQEAGALDVLLVVLNGRTPQLEAVRELFGALSDRVPVLVCLSRADEWASNDKACFLQLATENKRTVAELLAAHRFSAVAPSCFVVHNKGGATTLRSVVPSDGMDVLDVPDVLGWIVRQPTVSARWRATLLQRFQPQNAWKQQQLP